MNRSLTTSDRGMSRVHESSLEGTRFGVSTRISSSFASCWAYAVAAMPSFTHTAKAWVAAGTAIGVANTKRSPQRLGESLT